MNRAVMGAGAFGTGLAIALSATGPVALWARNGDDATRMAATRRSGARLSGLRLPDGVRPTAAPEAVEAAQIVLIAVPMGGLRNLLDIHGALLQGKALVACCKGMEIDSHLGPAGLIADRLPGASVAILTGPGFARDIATGQPTALTLACHDSALGIRLQKQLSTPRLRLYRSGDVKGAELGGALKNVIAIGCGAAMGAGLGLSARAALMARGFSEMQRIARALGGRSETLAGLSGLGDLGLTCMSDRSRNYRYGQALGAGTPFDEGVTVEGRNTARAMARLANEERLDLPLISTIAALVEGRYDVQSAMAQLLDRPLRQE